MVHIDVALAVCLHGEFVENTLGSPFDTEDHNLVNQLGGSLGVKVLVTDGLGNRDSRTIVVVTDLSSLVVSVAVALTVVQVDVASGVRVGAHCVSVDLKTDGIFDGLSKRLSRVGEVQDWEDGTTSHEGTLFGISDLHDVDIITRVNLNLGVDVIPLGGGWQVDLDLGGGASNGVLDTRVADFRADKNVRSEHELMVQVKGDLILRELVPHRADDGETGLGGLEEQVVHVMSLSVSLLDGSTDGTLDAGALKPWLTHLEALL